MRGLNESPEPRDYHEHYMDLTISTPGPTSSPEEAMGIPGCCVKSKERVDDKWPKWFGRLVSISEEKVIVISHPQDKDERFIWKGTKVQYFSLWDCD
jgi:hypothetical protein